MANEYINKVVYNNNTLIDLTSDTITANDLLSGKTAHGRDGAPIEGACTFDSNTTDADATASEILSTKTAYVNKVKITGSMTNRGGVTGTISTKAGEYTIQNGYHDGSGKVSIDSTEQAKIIPSNIRSGVEILGVTGTMSGSEDAYAQTTTVTPTASTQVITPSGYVLLENEPSDWSTDYTSYYTRSGDTYTHVTGDSAPTWAANTYYAAYTYLAQVTVNQIPYDETDNAAGGVTVTIG